MNFTWITAPLAADIESISIWFLLIRQLPSSCLEILIIFSSSLGNLRTYRLSHISETKPKLTYHFSMGWKNIAKSRGHQGWVGKRQQTTKNYSKITVYCDWGDSHITGKHIKWFSQSITIWTILWDRKSMLMIIQNVPGTGIELENKDCISNVSHLLPVDCFGNLRIETWEVRIWSAFLRFSFILNWAKNQ